MAKHHHHHQHHKHHRSHKRDGATIFKERSLWWIEFRKKIEKAIKIALLIIAILMAIAVIWVYKFG